MERYLPIQCYASERRDYKPRRLVNPTLILFHWFSAIHVKPAMAYDPDTCWQLWRDMNFDEHERLYNIYHDDPKRTWVSAHMQIDRNGYPIQLVPWEFQAWHAGKSTWNGLEGLNRHSFGIELIGSDGVPFEEPQYLTLAKVCRELMAKHRISITGLVGHDMVAPGRKIDPSGSKGDGFDYDFLRDRIIRG